MIREQSDLKIGSFYLIEIKKSLKKVVFLYPSISKKVLKVNNNMKKKYSISLDDGLYELIPSKNNSDFVNLCLQKGLHEYNQLRKESDLSVFRQICNATIDDRELATRFEEYPGQVKS